MDPGCNQCEVRLDGASLTVDQVVAVGASRATVSLDPQALARVGDNRTAVEAGIAAGQRIYGAGAMLPGAEQGLSAWEVEHDIVRGTAAGVGPPLTASVARAAQLIRLNGLLRARSGVRTSLLEAIVALLNTGLAPRIPSQGSAGASGDLAPSAHGFLPLLGEGAFVNDGTGIATPAKTALDEHGLKPFQLAAKEAIAILNGTHVMAAVGAHICERVANLLDTADAIAAMTIDALRGFTAPFDPRIHELRPLAGQRRCAENVRLLLLGSLRVDSSDRLHDAYSLRCVPQVHGSARHAFGFFHDTIALELNSATDNPLVFDDPLEVISAGNFHGQPLALVFDTLRLALADLAAFSERRLFRLVSPSLNGDLPPYLVGADRRGLGYMVPQIVCSTLVAELRVLAQPVSIDSVPTLDDIEDHVSFGMNGALLTQQACGVLERVLAIEAIAAAQALETGSSPSPPVGRLRDLIRETIAPLTAQRPPADDIEAARVVITGRQWSDLVNALLR